VAGEVSCAHERPRRVGLLFAINLALVLAFAGSPSASRPRAGPDVLDLELSFTSGAFRQILLVWRRRTRGGGDVQDQRSRAGLRLSGGLRGLLSALYVWVVTTGGGRPLRTGRVAPWIAAGLDWIENVLLLTLMRGVHDPDSIRSATFSPGWYG